MEAPALRTQWKKASLFSLMSAITLALAACGGGSSSGVSGPAGSTSTTPGAAGTTTSANAVPSSVNGTVAHGNPVSGGYVVAIDVNGNKCGSATTASDGTYSMNTTCAPGPVEFAVLSGAPNNIPLVTLAISSSANAPVSGTVNINPLTTMIVYDFLGTQTVLSGVNSPNSFSQVVGFIPTLESAAYQLSGSTSAFSAVAAAYQNAANQVLSALAQTLSNYGISVSAGFNPVTTPFTANGQGVDAFFDANPETVSGSNNLQLGTGSNPILSITFSGSSSSPATLGGSAAANATTNPATSVGTGSAPSGSTSTASGGSEMCTPGTYCYALLGKSISISEINQQPSTNNQYQVTCTGTVASTPTTVTDANTGQPAQVALITGTCIGNGTTSGLKGQVAPVAIGSPVGPNVYNFAPIETIDGLYAAVEWFPSNSSQNTSVPTSYYADPGSSLGIVSGSLIVN